MEKLYNSLYYFCAGVENSEGRRSLDHMATAVIVTCGELILPQKFLCRHGKGSHSLHAVIDRSGVAGGELLLVASPMHLQVVCAGESECTLGQLQIRSAMCLLTTFSDFVVRMRDFLDLCT